MRLEVVVLNPEKIFLRVKDADQKKDENWEKNLRDTTVSY